MIKPTTGIPNEFPVLIEINLPSSQVPSLIISEEIKGDG